MTTLVTRDDLRTTASTVTPERITEARAWLREASISQHQATDTQVIRAIMAHYAGGWAAFVDDTAALDTVPTTTIGYAVVAEQEGERQVTHAVMIGEENADGVRYTEATAWDYAQSLARGSWAYRAGMEGADATAFVAAITLSGTLG